MSDQTKRPAEPQPSDEQIKDLDAKPDATREEQVKGGAFQTYPSTSGVKQGQ